MKFFGTFITVVWIRVISSAIFALVSVEIGMCRLDDSLVEPANLHVAAEPVLTTHDLTGFLS